MYKEKGIDSKTIYCNEYNFHSYFLASHKLFNKTTKSSQKYEEYFKY